ncbi:MAG: hypothetical protein EBR82_11965 [Caulobacteraceae bacterium]|nr:hypothetical protein [Caulobacteraceae bacterium]
MVLLFIFKKQRTTMLTGGIWWILFLLALTSLMLQKETLLMDRFITRLKRMCFLQVFIQVLLLPFLLPLAQLLQTQAQR